MLACATGAGAGATSGLGTILVELVRLSDSGRLARVKTCDSDECRWIFYDRSKPGNQRWCSSVLCGNREKTRSYRGSGRLRTIKPMNVVDARRHWYSFVRIRRLPPLWPQGGCTHSQ